MILDKLKALMEQGVGGEKINAEKILRKILQKQGKSFEEFVTSKDKEETMFYCLRYKTQYEKRLLLQICHYVLNLPEIQAAIHNNIIHIRLTAYQHIEIITIYTILKTELKKELDITTEAFICKNRIFSQSVTKKDENSSLTEKELRVIERMSTIKKTELRKQLTAPKLTGANK